MSTHEEYMTRRQARDLARRLARLERKTRSTAAAHADLRHSALDHGARIPVKDDQGNTTAFVGSGPTGIEHVGGPVPAQPSEPFVDVGGEVVKIQHSGLDVHEDPAPADFRRAQIHVSQTETFEPSLSTLAGYLEEADGSFTHRLPGGEWYVGIVWETLSGKQSVMSGTVLADIPPLVDTSDLEDTLATAQERLDTYRDEVAQPRFQALEEGLSENNDNLANARERLGEAESLLDATVDDVAENRQDAQDALDRSTAAAAAAIEANNRAMTRLANGNFESGLDYWDHDNVELTSTAHSGQQAAQVSGWLRPGSSFPVVPDQIWELSLYHQYDVTVEFQAIDEVTRTTLSTHHLDGDSTWSDSGALRVTIPADVHMLSFTITGTSAIVDDITLRDVTDVVRLEEAANANRQKAEQAISELAVMRLAVDGEGGLKDRLATAETTLETKADTSALDQLDQKLAGGLAAFEAHYTRVWRQPTPPPPGTHYAWLGEPHESVSVRLDGDGNELARNLITNPTMGNGVTEWVRNGGAVLSVDRDVKMTGNGSLKVSNVQASNHGVYSRLIVRDHLIPGTPVLAKAWVKAPEGVELRTQVQNQGTGGGTENTVYTATGDWQEIIAYGGVVSETRQPYLRVTLNQSLPEPIDYWIDRAIMASSDSEESALSQVEHYFDGDTESDRANDLWYNQDGVPHEWVNGQGWVELSDARITELANTVSAHATRLENAETELEEALEGPIDHERLRVGTGAFDQAFASKLIADHATIINAAMRNLSVEEKLLFAEAIGESIWAELGVFDRLQAREGWIGDTLLADGAVTAEKITATRELITKIMGAEWAYISERLVVEGDLIANHADIISAAIKNLSVTERADLFEAFITTLGAQEATIDMLVGKEAWITSAMISELTAEKVTVTENFVGRVAELLHLVVDRIDANTLWADQTWQAAGHFGSEQADQSTLVDGTGLRITKHDRDDDTSTDIVRLGGEGIGLVFADEDGEVTGSLSHEGDASFRDVAVESLSHGGRPLQDPECQDYVHPSGNQSLISWRPRAVVGRAETVLPNTVNTPYREYGFIEVAARLEAGRSYWLTVTPFLSRNAEHNSNYLHIRATTDGTHPNGSSPLIKQIRNVVGGNDMDILWHAQVLYTPEVTGLHRFMVSVYAINGVRMTFSGQTVQFIVEDAGAAIPDAAVVRDTYMQHPSGQPDVIGPIHSGDSTTAEWHAQWFQNYSHNGTTRTTSNSSTGGYGSGSPTQGLRTNRPEQGRWASFMGFGVSTNEQTLQQALAGADIQSITLEARGEGSFNDANTFRAFFYAQPQATAPTQYTSTNLGVPLFGGASQLFNVGQARRIDLPVDTFGPLLKSGDFRSIGLWSSSDHVAYSGRLSWNKSRVKLIISYTKEGN